ncbi:hypothetical protein CRUP_022493 [Coryphaenoides rupestris]|nr:hypothetical protein CRUP_022493 [Coryphaenoides rupestris]
MACTRPLISVYSEKGESSGKNVVLPAVFKSPIRPDVVNFVHTNMRKNNRQPYAVSKLAGHQTSAESWGTGRAVARIPRVRGGGTTALAREPSEMYPLHHQPCAQELPHAFCDGMCRGGRMFAPTKTWRRWHRRININQKRYAICSALAASALPGLVMSKGESPIDTALRRIPEIPLVVDDKVEAYKKTKDAVLLLKKLKAWNDVKKVYASQRMRAGKGITLQNVNKLNLLRLAPGGHVGRFCIWTESAFRKLDQLYGTGRKTSSIKKNYNLPVHKMTNTDLSRILKSEEIQKALSCTQVNKKVNRRVLKKNPLKNLIIMMKLNPYAKTARRHAILQHDPTIKAKMLKSKKGKAKKRSAKKTKKVAAGPVAPAPAPAKA